jgi:hypothetical protein
VLVPLPAGRFLFGRLIGREGPAAAQAGGEGQPGKLHLLPPGAGGLHHLHLMPPHRPAARREPIGDDGRQGRRHGSILP